MLIGNFVRYLHIACLLNMHSNLMQVNYSKYGHNMLFLFLNFSVGKWSKILECVIEIKIEMVCNVFYMNHQYIEHKIFP